MVCRAGGYFGEPFVASQSIMQGGALSGLMFNVCVNAVVREWLQQMLGHNVAQDGMEEAVRNYVVAFFVDDGLVAVRCLEWLQSSFTILVTLFKCIGLWTNAAKTKVITCLPGRIQVARMEEEYTAQQARDATMTKCQRVVCNVCDASLATESLQSRLETQHDMYRSFVLNQDLVPEQAAVVYHATESLTTSIYSCPVPQCGGQSGTRFNLCWHFLMRHPQDLICIPIEGSKPLPQCIQCGFQKPVEDLNQGNHHTGLCQRGWERKRQHVAAVRSQQAINHMFTAYGEELERVEVFKYMGRLIACNDANNQAMRSNLRTAWGCWAWVSCVLWAENASP
jgi:hypothetical protein